jgi:hypothetical protein
MFYGQHMAGDLANTLRKLGVSTADFAKLARVTTRAVNMWLTGEREMPGPASAYLNLFAELPRALQKKELARVKDEDPAMFEGMYGIQFVGTEGFGVGILVLMGGKVFGCDEGRVTYDGHYEPSQKRKKHLDVVIRVTVPAGVAAVTGVPPQPVTYWFDLRASIPTQEDSIVEVTTPYGAVCVRVTYMRGIPQDLAA